MSRPPLAKTRVLREDPARRVLAALARNPCSQCGRPLPADQYCPQCRRPHCPICGVPHRLLERRGGWVEPCRHYLAIAGGTLQNGSFDAIIQSELLVLINPRTASYFLRGRHMRHLPEGALRAELGDRAGPFIACLAGLQYLTPAGYTCLLLALCPPPVFAWTCAEGATVGFLSEDRRRAASLVREVDVVVVEGVTTALREEGGEGYGYLGAYRGEGVRGPFASQET